MLIISAYTVDEAIQCIGFGWFQIRAVVIVGMAWVSHLYSSTLFHGIELFNNQKYIYILGYDLTDAAGVLKNKVLSTFHSLDD